MKRTSAVFPLAWERVLWTGRPGLAAPVRLLHERYHVTDCRVVVRSRSGGILRELPIDDIHLVQLRQSFWERIRGRCTLVVRPRRADTAPIELADQRQGPQLALALELLAAERFGFEDEREFLAGALRGDAPGLLRSRFAAPAALAALVVAVAGAIVATHPGRFTPSSRHTVSAATRPPGTVRTRAEMIAFMERDVMPVARRVFGPLKGGPDRVTCQTCHGRQAEARDWKMPAVEALPQPQFRRAGLEIFNTSVDAQVRNAIYGYLAEEDKQSRAAYMRSVVTPEIARVLARPPYDFTKSYEYNRSRAALGCYHCHRVEAVGRR